MLLSSSSSEIFCLSVPARTRKYPRWLVPTFLWIVSLHGLLLPVAILLLPTGQQRNKLHDLSVSNNLLLDCLTIWTFDLLPFLVARLFLCHLGISLIYIGFSLLGSDALPRHRHGLCLNSRSQQQMNIQANTNMNVPSQHGM